MRVVAAYPDRVLTHDDAGLRTGFEGAVNCLDAGPAGVYAGTADGIRRETTDGWERVADIADVTALAVTDAGVWAGTEPSAVYHARDGEDFAACADVTDLPSADTWSFPPRPSTHHVRWLEHAGERLYAAIEAGALLRSPDGGGTWQDRVPSGPRDTHSMATHPDRPDLAYAAAGDGFFVTEDGGDTWTSREAGLDHTYCWSVVCDPTDPRRVLAAAAPGPRSAHDAGRAESAVYRWEPGASAWVQCTGLPGPEGLLVPVLATTGERGTAVAATNHGLYRTTDWGETWTELTEDWPDALASERPRGVAVA